MNRGTGLDIVVVGAGNVATHLAHAFAASGNRIAQVYSRKLETAQVLAQRFGVPYTNNLAMLKANADVYIFSVADDALFDITSHIRLADKICFHTSGTVPMEVMAAVTNNYGVVYAPQTFVKHIAMDYSVLPFCIEASNQYTLDTLLSMVKNVSDNVHILSSEQRKYLHLASVFANNFGNCINAMAQHIMSEHNLPFEIVQPLIQETANKATQGNLWQLQTGPARRGDTKTLEKHRALLSDTPDYLEVYNLLTSMIEKHTEN